MKITLQNVDRLSLAEIREFVEGSRRVEFADQERQATYELIERVLRGQRYRQLSKGQRGVVRRFLVKITGLSRAQVTRLIAQWMRERQVKSRPAKRPKFRVRYNKQDVALLAAVDAAHEDLSGAAVRRILKREYEVSATRIMRGYKTSRWRTSTISGARHTIASTGCGFTKLSPGRTR